MAKHLVQKICERPSDPNAPVDFVSRAKAALLPWHGCRAGGVNKCLALTYPKLYIVNGHDLYVTNYLARPDPDLLVNSRVPPFPHDHREDYSQLGGIKKMLCRWAEDRNDDFPCYFYDTDNPEGWFDPYLERGAGERDVSPSPLAAPFFSLRTPQRRAIVFPASLLPGSTTTWIGSAPLSQRIDDVVAANDALDPKDANRVLPHEVDLFDWTTIKHDYGHGSRRTLEVRTRTRPASAGGPRCGWVSVNANSSALTGQNLSRCLRYMYPSQS